MLKKIGDVTVKNPQNYTTLKTGADLTCYQPSYDNLGEDRYHPVTGGRTRRLGQYYARYDRQKREAEIHKLKTQVYVQGEKFNKSYGAMKRYFEDIEVDFKPLLQILFREIEDNWLVDEDEWMINVHQFRVHAKTLNDGVAAPEGKHRDGAEYVYMGCVARENVTGGISHIFEGDDTPPIFGTTLVAGEGILVDDREVLHDVTPIVAEGDYGYRDMVIVGYHLWSDNKYPGDWKDNIYELKMS
ncbi:MAG: 2OG-Fe dioxygenase family protein [Pseudomonadota bacterium]